MAAILSKPRLLPKSQKAFYLKPILDTAQKKWHYMFFAVFEGTYNVIITLRNIRITNSALGVPID